VRDQASLPNVARCGHVHHQVLQTILDDIGMVDRFPLRVLGVLGGVIRRYVEIHERVAFAVEKTSVSWNLE